MKINRFVFQVYTISLDDFPIDKRIGFFDALLEYYGVPETDVEWRLQHVCGIVVRQEGKSSKTDKVMDITADLDLSDRSEEDEHSTRRVKPSDLKSITRAVLEGENLRTNSFVKSCESAGFFFSSMTLELQNKNNPELIRVQIRFKESPKIFEVIIQKTATLTEIGEQAAQFTQQREQAILLEFWNVSHMLWHRIRDGLPKVIGKERQFVMNLADSSGSS